MADNTEKKETLASAEQKSDASQKPELSQTEATTQPTPPTAPDSQKTTQAGQENKVPVKKTDGPKEASFDTLRPGDTVRVHQKIKQGDKERIQIFEGVIIAKKGKSDITRTITVRKIASGGFGVEKIFPLASPLIEKMETINRPKRIRRSKLYYLRESARKIKELREKK